MDKYFDLIGGRWAVEVLTAVVYELLDAHDDIARLAAESGLDQDPRWEVQLDYLRGLQRVAREDLALAASASQLP